MWAEIGMVDFVKHDNIICGDKFKGLSLCKLIYGAFKLTKILYSSPKVC